MEDDKSTEVAQSDASPAEDPILNALSDDASEDDTSTDSSNADETQDDDSTDAEATPEAAQPKENQEAAQQIDPKEEARRRYEERQAFREEQRAKVREQVSNPYVAEATDQQEMRIRAVEVRDYERLIEATQDKIVGEFDRARNMPELQIFNPDSPEFNQRVYDKAMRDYNAGYITYDDNENMVGVKGSLLTHLIETAELLKDVKQSGAVQQIRATRQMRSNSDVKPAASPKESARDPILDILKSE